MWPAQEKSGASTATRADAPSDDSSFESSAFDRSLDSRFSGRSLRGAHITRRRNLLVFMAILGCVALVAWAYWLAGTPHIAGKWVANSTGGLQLQTSTGPELAALQGRTLTAVIDANGKPLALDAAVLHRSPRWHSNDRARAASVAQNDGVSRALANGPVQLQFDNGQRATLKPQGRGFADLGWLFWPIAGAALLLYLFAWSVVLARPQTRNLLYLLMALCQCGNLLVIALHSVQGLGLPAGAAALDMPLRLALDAYTGAAIAHAFALHPLRLKRAGALAAGVWGLAAGGTALVVWGGLPQQWWWAQGLCLLLGLVTLGIISRSYRQEPSPYALALRRFNIISLLTLLLVTVAVAAANTGAGTASAVGPFFADGVGDQLAQNMARNVAEVASVAWYLFLASLLLLAPFLSGSRQVLRECALLAGISSVAASLDVLFVSLFALGPFASLTIAVFVSLAVYTAARQFLLNQMLGSSRITTERTFDQLYRAAREVQAQPSHYPQVLTQLLRELFEPLELLRLARVPAQSRVAGNGSSLIVPMWVTGSGLSGLTGPAGWAAQGTHPQRDGEEAVTPVALVLRFAQRGQRLFSLDDARLADRIVEQLRRAVAYDQAVERGRTEERMRLAQDLHDDIGARLLTLMYQAQNPEMEDYIRHTLQDLKTLTRGLAASRHQLSHAAAEWKADLSQRLVAARAELVWSFASDRDPTLSVVQWSALTRVLRELVSNALYHGHATRVEVVFVLEKNALALQVSDDGQGRNPKAWAHGLGLGGVRKRVKLLGGTVAWLEGGVQGIVCEVHVPKFLAAPAP
jgi:signal transduction histidine kinase